MTQISIEDQYEIVHHLTAAVSEKLGRAAYSRKVKNREEYYIFDPVLSFITRGDKGGLGYRVGYRVDFSYEEENELMFTLLHNPVMANLFKRNLAFSTLVKVIRATAEFRSDHWVYRSSKLAYKKGLDGKRIENFDLEEFLIELAYFHKNNDFIKDMFPKRRSTGKRGGEARAAGNTFYLLLADNMEMLATLSGARRIVDYSWPLFLCLYPVKPLEGRDASLARSMKAKRIPRQCEYHMIKLPPGTRISPLCRGVIHGAHIKPHSLGGSDRPENGIWLCEYHHRATEGKLSGRRDGDILNPKLTLTP